MSILRNNNGKYAKAAALFAAATFSVAALAGCGDKDGADKSAESKDSGVTQSQESSDANVSAEGLSPEKLVGNWQLVSGKTAQGELTPVPDNPVTLDIASPTEISGRICNNYSGQLTLEKEADKDDVLRFTTGPLAQTKMACPDEAVTQVEDRYMEAIAGVTSAEMSGSDLVLKGADIELKFSPAAEAK